MAWPADLSMVDAAMLAVLGVSVLVGLWRGLVFEVMSLLGWLVAYAAARVYAPNVALWLPQAPQAVAFVATFFAVLLGWAVLTRLLRGLVRATPLAVLDRLLGGAFGGLRGGVLLLVVATVVSMTPAARTPAWQQSRGAAGLQVLIDAVRQWLPGEFGRYLPGQA